jgi:hypothetical protein
MAHHALPAEVCGLVDWWMLRIRQILGRRLRSVVLGGSAAVGDYVHGWSDVDVCVVLDGSPTEADGEAIRRLHDEMRGVFVGDERGCSQVIEGPHVPAELIADPSASAVSYVAGSSTGRRVTYAFSPFDRYMLAHFGQVLAREPVAFPPPGRPALVAQFYTDVHRLLAPPRDPSAVWFAGMIHWTARSLAFWRDGILLGKTRALEQEIAAGSPFAGAMRAALECRQAGSLATRIRLEKMRGHFEAVARPASEALVRTVEGEGWREALATLAGRP